MRVLLETTKNTSLPSQAEDYDDLVSSTVTQIGQWYVDRSTTTQDFWDSLSGRAFATNYTSGMGYVIRLADGSFIVVDGGYGTETHVDNLYNVLVEQSENRDIVIAAWIFTHAHNDHADAFKVFTNKYHTKVTVESFIYNFPTEKAAAVCDDSPNLDQITEAMAIYPEAKTVIAHAGQVHYIRNAVVNILYTYDMMMPYKMVDYNATSVVFNVQIEGSTILFLGDAGGESDNVDGELTHIAKFYNNSKTVLGANIVQVAHHGIDKHSKVAKFYNIIMNDVDYALIPVAHDYIKIGEDTYIKINERSACSTLTGVDKYIAGYSVTVLTLNDGSVTPKPYTDVSTYVNS